MAIRHDLIHDHCAHRTGYLFQKNDGDHGKGWWSWHRDRICALRERTKHGGKVFRIISDDHTEQVP